MKYIGSKLQTSTIAPTFLKSAEPIIEVCNHSRQAKIIRSLTNPVVNELGESKATKGSVDFSTSLTNGHGICQRTK